jgi:hypothetical protein
VRGWDSIRQAVQAALAAQPDALDRLGRCRAIAVYTDGSAPLETPRRQRSRRSTSRAAGAWARDPPQAEITLDIPV